jgi:hypothetical protein
MQPDCAGDQEDPLVIVCVEPFFLNILFLLRKLDTDIALPEEGKLLGTGPVLPLKLPLNDTAPDRP